MEFTIVRILWYSGRPMLQTLRLGQNKLAPWSFVPPFLAPLANAANNGADVIPVIQSITNSFGFDTFMYGTSTSVRPDHESRMFVFTTAPREWVLRYDQMAYIEVDPRVMLLWDSTLPLVWDQRIVRGARGRIDSFLDDALEFGIGSGVCIPLGDDIRTRVIVALNSRTPELNEARRQEIATSLGDIVLLAHYFHELFMTSAIRRSEVNFTGRPLSSREIECLNLAARGMTTEDIGLKLGIGGRTVQFHFDSIRSKLAAANRQEAVARAVKAGIISI